MWVFDVKRVTLEHTNMLIKGIITEKKARPDWAGDAPADNFETDDTPAKPTSAASDTEDLDDADSDTPDDEADTAETRAQKKGINLSFEEEMENQLLHRQAGWKERGEAVPLMRCVPEGTTRGNFPKFPHVLFNSSVDSKCETHNLSSSVDVMIRLPSQCDFTSQSKFTLPGLKLTLVTSFLPICRNDFSISFLPNLLSYEHLYFDKLRSKKKITKAT